MIKVTLTIDSEHIFILKDNFFCIKGRVLRIKEKDNTLIGYNWQLSHLKSGSIPKYNEDLILIKFNTSEEAYESMFLELSNYTTIGPINPMY